jgi:hypothetical protein
MKFFPDEVLPTEDLSWKFERWSKKRERTTHMHIFIFPSLSKPPPIIVKLKPVASLASCKKELITEPIISMHLLVNELEYCLNQPHLK